MSDKNYFIKSVISTNKHEIERLAKNQQKSNSR